MQVVIVVAKSENDVIGRDGGLPWHISEDLKHFKAVTMGHPIIMGRKTWESIGRPLPGRANIVITRNETFDAEGAVVVSSLDAAIARCRDDGAEKAMIIGGGQIYTDAMKIADVIELTEVAATIDGDTVFPDIDPETWQEVARSDIRTDEKSKVDYCFVTLQQR